MIQLTILRWEIILDYPGGPSIITKFLIRKRRRQESQRRCDKEVRGQHDEGHRLSKQGSL